MIGRSELRDDLDVFTTKYNPKSGQIAINIPTVDASIFKTNSFDYYTFGEAKISMPPEIPDNAALIAVHTFNNSNKTDKIDTNIETIFKKYFSTETNDSD